MDKIKKRVISQIFQSLTIRPQGAGLILHKKVQLAVDMESRRHQTRFIAEVIYTF